MKNTMQVGIQLQYSYAWTNLYPAKVMRSVQKVMIRIPANPGTSPLTALRSWAPTMALAADQPTQAITFRTATGKVHVSSAKVCVEIEMTY
jgi:hypothetical protein